MEDFAVIQLGGKQYLVRENEVLTVEKCRGESGQGLEFEPLLVWRQGRLHLKRGAVKAELLRQEKSSKIIVFKYKPKVRYRRTKGHRQPVSVIRITKISA